ncbi:MAG: ParB N-terminal domain-containing protein, partial [Planctomycetota bacterium]
MSNILIDSLTPHPINSSIYSNRPDDDLVNSIRKYGIRVPLIVKADNTIISGHRRWAAAKKAGLESVPVDVVEFESEADEWRAMLIANQYRQEKRSSEMLEEAALWKRVYAAEATASKSEACSHAGKIAGRGRPKDENRVPHNCAEPYSDRETRKKVAEKVGVSHATLERIQKVKSAAATGDPVAQQAWQQLDDGEITAHRAYT